MRFAWPNIAMQNAKIIANYAHVSIEKLSPGISECMKLQLKPTYQLLIQALSSHYNTKPKKWKILNTPLICLNQWVWPLPYRQNNASN